ncbi:hypothetical protein ZEAMMB73_Zm00001d033323 [Zea mays]|uniref:Uncharacterized protein n=1 Tax=Zea mays TaxID=4577 RepID=A0A1D6KXR3_MAIZE|nr:hypothetical protein ZEAMMB73_Zm00001d033323 [Zea mays]
MTPYPHATANDPHDGKRKCEALWPIFRISHQRSHFIYGLYYKRKEISQELYEFLDPGYADYYDRDPKRIKTKIIDSELSVGSVSDKDSEQDCDDVFLKDLRTQCKAKNWKTSKITSKGCGIKNQAKTEDDIDLDKPLIALKQKSPKTSLAKDNVKMNTLRFSPCATKEEDTTSQRDKILSSSLIKATMQDPVLEKLGRKFAELEQSKVVIDCTKIVGEQICCVEVNNTAGALASCAKPDVLCEIKAEDTNYSEFGTSICSIKNPEHSSFKLQQKLVAGDDCVPQSRFMTRTTQLADVSNHPCEQTCSINNFDDITAAKATEVSLLGLTDETSNHQKTSENLTDSDVCKSSTANGFMACSFNQSCHDLVDSDEHWNLFVHRNEHVKLLEELSSVDESCADTQSDLCGSTKMNCTSLEGVVQMQAEGQLDSIVCCGVRPKHMLLDMEIRHTETGIFTFDKTIDLTHPANFVAQDGRLESIVYDVLNNHAQRTASKNESFVGLPETAVTQSSLIDFTVNCFEDKRASVDKILPPNNLDWPLKDKLNSTTDYDICRPINDDEGSEEELVPQHQLYQSCSDKFNLSSAMPEISNAEESQKISAGAQNSSATFLETDGRIKKPIFFLWMKNQLKKTLKKYYCPRERLCHRRLRRSFAVL